MAYGSHVTRINYVKTLNMCAAVNLFSELRTVNVRNQLALP